MRLFPRTIIAALIFFALLSAGSLQSYAQIVLEYSGAVGVGNEPVDVATGDIDGDGDLDLVVANLSGNSFTILHNNGLGDFSQRDEIPLPDNRKAPDTIALSDFNGDGRMDIALGILSEVDPLARLFVNQGLLILLAQPDGGYTPNYLEIEGSPGLVVPMDKNGDGAPDIVLANLGVLDFSNIFNVSVEGAGVDFYLNQGNGTFVHSNLVETDGSVSPIALADVNGDGNVDIVATNQGALNALSGQLEGYNITILLNNGSGGFSTGEVLTCSTFPFSAAAADFDGDGDADIIAAEQGTATMIGGVIPDSAGVSYWWNNGDGTFSDETYNTEQGVPTMIKVADLDGDGDLDFVLTNSGMDTSDGNLSNPALTVFTNDGTGAFEQTSVLSVGEEPNSMAIGDWNGDGSVDVAVVSKANNLVNVFLNKSPGAVPVRDWSLY